MIRVYFLNIYFLSDDKIFNNYYSECSDFRKEIIDGFSLRKDKNLSLGASILLNSALKEYGVSEKEMEYFVSKNGKPYFKNLSNVFFNISHSEEFVMVVISDCEVGCDIEKITSIDFKIASRYFCQSENENFLKRKAGMHKTKSFFRLWTLKESFIKCIGLGLYKPFNAFEVKIEKNTPFIVDENGERFDFYEYNIQGYKSAICSKEIRNVKLKVVEL